MLTCDYLILGGGPAGLGAAARLQEAGADWLLCEREALPGGAAASFQDPQGFTWDLGGHVLFSHYEAFDRRIDAACGVDAWVCHRRESWVWYRDRFVPYPFQYNLHRLPGGESAACLEGIEAAAARRDGAPPAHFRELLLRTFGEALCERFMFPYNLKVWGWPLEELACDWIGERVAIPDPARIRAGIAARRDDVDWGPNNTFRFPLRGGTGAVWQAVAARLPAARMLFDADAATLDTAARRATLRDGRPIAFSSCISTVPLDRLGAMTGDPELLPAMPLKGSATHVVGIGLSGSPPPALREKCWIYFPGANSPYYRVTVFSNYSPHNVPQPGRQWSLMAEVSETPAKPVDARRLAGDCLAALVEDGLVPSAAAVVSTAQRRVPYGYPTPFLGRAEVVGSLLRRLEARGIYSRGRFGAWNYEAGNMDHAFMQGMECAGRLLRGGGPACEPTLFDSRRVNRGYNREEREEA